MPILSHGQSLPPIRDYTQEEYELAMLRKDELIVYKGSKAYLTPKIGVQIPVEVPDAEMERQYLLVLTALAALP